MDKKEFKETQKEKFRSYLYMAYVGKAMFKTEKSFDEFTDKIWQWIEQQLKEARVDELQLLLTNTNVNQIKDEDIFKRIKELNNG